MKSSRTFARDARRVIIKVGTTVVTRSDGKLAIGRIGYLCEQVKALLTKGIEVVIVSSGAVGIGRHKLFTQQLINRSFSDLLNPQKELGGNPSAAVGQNGLIALYENLLSQLDVQSSQILLMENDFKDIEFIVELRKTIDTLLELQVVPIFNENDAISNRRATYEDLMRIFWDNDSLAALLALELKADLLILLSDVEGLYSGPPSEPGSKLIHTYIKEKHDDSITFGEKSRVGRGGMTAKVCAAKQAAESGIPVIITSGYATDGIIRVMNGERIGTLFHKDAHLLESRKEATSRQMAMGAKEASRRLQMLSSSQRNNILLNIADALEANENEIREKNMEDVEHARKDGVSESLISLLMLKPGMISRLAKSLREIAGMEEPLGKVLSRKEVAENLIMEEVTCPLGVLLIIFEPQPDALVQIASLAIRSGNGLLLKGGKEASRTNSILHKVITEVLPEAVGKGLIALISSREEIPDLLKLNDIIDLVIPRGSNKLVSDIKESTKIAILGHADGVCQVYVDKSADMDKAKKIVLDAKVDCPTACNAMETLLVHEALIETRGLQELIYLLQNKGVTLYGGIRSTELLKLPKAVSFHKEYSSMACTIHVVEDVYEAINHIHKYGSTHTDCIIAEDTEVAETFLHNVDSAAVFHNASTRFSDGARFGLGAEVGISTNRIHARGPVGVEGLLTCRWLLRGCGQIVNNKHGVVYTHNDILTNTSTSTNKNENENENANSNRDDPCIKLDLPNGTYCKEISS